MELNSMHIESIRKQLDICSRFTEIVRGEGEEWRHILSDVDITPQEEKNSIIKTLEMTIDPLSDIFLNPTIDIHRYRNIIVWTVTGQDKNKNKEYYALKIYFDKED